MYVKNYVGYHGYTGVYRDLGCYGYLGNLQPP
jgi:hypothetical protein